MTKAAHLLALAAALTGCPHPSEEPFFPEGYATTYREVRRCQQSSDHDLNTVRVLTDEAAAPIYLARDGGFAPGTVILKAEYDFGDTACSGPVKKLTAMRRGADGGSPATLDWSWQTVDPARTVLDSDLPRCIGCHTTCGRPPDGHEATCGY